MCDLAKPSPDSKAQDAFRVYSALALLSVGDPELGRLPLMQELRQLAYERFNAAFVGL